MGFAKYTTKIAKYTNFKKTKKFQYTTNR